MDDREHATYRRFEEYDFSANADYNAGFDVIRAERAEMSPELVTMAQAYYYDQHVEPLNYASYLSWKQECSGDSRPTAVEKDSVPYPASFSEIVALIQSGKAIPGIKMIPDRLADVTPDQSSLQAPQKPWDVTLPPTSREPPPWMAVKDTSGDDE
ncbi:hypothetical protein PYCC9005_002630 [Savitreella phatthalungensis]